MLDFAIYLLWLFVKIGGAAVVGYLAVIVYLHFRAVKRLDFYEKQGAVLYPGCKSFFFGNMWDMMAYQEAYCGEDPVPGPQQWIAMTGFLKKLGHEPSKKFDASEFPVLALNFQAVPQVWVSDPDIVQDIFGAKNALLDKEAENLIMFEDIIGQSFLFTHNDDAWKMKRKASAHAFYKERLVMMLETLKDKTANSFENWAAKARASPTKTYDFNMATDFSEILARNIIHVSFGEDLCDELFNLQVKQANGEYESKSLKLKDAIYVMIDQVCHTFYTNVRNPLNWLYPYTDKVFQFSAESKIVKQNCLDIRDWIKDYIKKRQAGTRKSSVQGETDILKLMLDRPDVFTDEVITDELLGFFGAATETTHNVMITICTYLAKSPECVARIRAEFEKVLDEQSEDEKKESFAQRLQKTVTVDNCFDLEYLSMVIQEGLRFNGPGGISCVQYEQDVTLAKKLTVKKGDRVKVLNWALHSNPAEWQRPHEFLPERFDPESPLYLTPSGKKRNPMSWVPFSGGKRVCFGKTFAESNMKIMLTYFTQYFDFQYADQKQFAGPQDFPVAVMFQSKNPPLMIRLKERAQKK